MATPPRPPGPPAQPRAPGPPAQPRAPGPPAQPRAPGPPAQPRAPGPPAQPRAPGPPAQPRAPGPPAQPRAQTPAAPAQPRAQTPGPPAPPRAQTPGPPAQPKAQTPGPPAQPRAPGPPAQPRAPGPPAQPRAPGTPAQPRAQTSAKGPPGPSGTKRAALPSNKAKNQVGLEQTQEEEPYDPFTHRDVKKPTSDFGALAHMLKTSLGSGILAMPMAFKNSGLVLGSIGTVVLGIICTHCIQMLVHSSQVLCVKHRVPTLSFAKTAELAFLNGPNSAKKSSRAMGVLITIQLLGSFILGNSVYVVFISHSMYQVIQFYWEPNIDVRYYVLMLWLPLILMCMLRNLKALVPFSILANLFVIVSFSIVIYYIFRSIQPTDSVNLVAPYDRIPLFMTTVIFSIEGIGTVLTIENEMQNPNHFIGGRCGIAYTAMTFVIVVYSVIGFFGYLQYGDATEGSITLNLPVKDTLAQTVKILIALAIFFTYALQFYVPINLLCDMAKEKVQPKYHIIVDLAIRISLVTFTIIISIAIPNLEPIIGLVGAICFSVLGLLMPSLIDSMIRYPNFGILKWRLIKNIFISTISLTVLAAGTYHSIGDIADQYKSKEV